MQENQISPAKRIEQLESQLQELHRQLMQAQKLSSVGALASSITHEFNNILTTIINYAKMGMRHKDEAIRDKAFDKISNAGLRASKITTGMLRYARNNSELQEESDLQELVEQCMILLQKDLQIHRISVVTAFDGRPWASVNSTQIQQVIINLIVNARQAMDSGGRLTVGLREHQGFAEVSVKDTGVGIPAEKLPKIFEQFYSTKQADGGGQGGTGLGLALCRDIMESHNGRIRVESKVGAGTTFTLRFPLAKVPAIRRTSEIAVG